MESSFTPILTHQPGFNRSPLLPLSSFRQSFKRSFSTQHPKSSPAHQKSPELANHCLDTVDPKGSSRDEGPKRYSAIEELKQEDPKFKRILEQIDLDGIRTMASSVRQAQGLTRGVNPDPVQCEVAIPPYHGSYNLAFKVIFQDGVEWLLKVPANGYTGAFDSLAASALKSEVETMRYIKRMTSIPVPTIHSYDTSVDNAVRCPFVLMDFMKGQSLFRAWFDEEASSYRREQIRIRALQTIAISMAQLSQLTFDQGGSLVFDTEGELIVGPAKIADFQAMREKYGEEEYPDHECDIFCKKGPFQDPKAALLFMLDRQDTTRKQNTYTRGVHKALRLFTGWAFDRADLSKLGEQQFALAHPDFDLQNILVEDDGTVCGFIDWDGVAAVPQSVGSLRFPNWLMRDWEPAFQNRSAHVENDANELPDYRVAYAQFLEMALSVIPTSNQRSKELACITRSSIVTGTLEIGASDPDFIPGIIANIFEQMRRAEIQYLNEENFESSSEGSADTGDRNSGMHDSGSSHLISQETDQHPQPNQTLETAIEAQVLQCPSDSAAKERADSIASAEEIQPRHGPSFHQPTHHTLIKVWAWLGTDIPQVFHALRRRVVYRTNVQVELEGKGVQKKWSKKVGQVIEHLKSLVRSLFAGGACITNSRPDLEAQTIEKSRLEIGSENKIDTKQDGSGNAKQCEDEWDTNKSSKANEPVVPFQEQSEVRKPGEIERTDVWSWITLEKKKCGITTSMLTGSQRSIIGWIIDHFKGKDKQEKTVSTSAVSVSPTPKAVSASTPPASMLPDYEDVSAEAPSKTAADDVHKSSPYEQGGDASRLYGLDIAGPIRPLNVQKLDTDHYVSPGHEGVFNIDRLLSEAYQAALEKTGGQRLESAELNNVNGSRAPTTNEGDGSDDDELREEDQEDASEDRGELVDNGGFTMEEVCVALGRGHLDEGRWELLRKSFNILLEWSMGLW